MQSITEKINFDNYEILKNNEDSLTGKSSCPEFTDMFDFYEIIAKFSMEEIVKKYRDFEELGRYLDYNLYLSSPFHFLGFFRFAYQPFYSQRLSSENVNIKNQFNLSIQYKIAEYVNEWIKSKILELGLQNSFESNYVQFLPLLSSIYPNIIQSYDRIKRDNFINILTAHINNQPRPLMILDDEIKEPPHQAEVKDFDNSILNQIMNDDMIESFLKHEKRLKADDFITSKNRWINGSGKNQTKTRKDLANLILLLKEKKYLKPKFDRKNLKDNDYKKFFEVRYSCKLKEQFGKAQKDTIKSLETAKTTFFYF